MLCEARLELFSVSALNNSHLFLFLRYFLFDALLYVLMLRRPGLYGFLLSAPFDRACGSRNHPYGAGWAITMLSGLLHSTS